MATHELSADIALHSPSLNVPVIPPCVHYAGTEKFIRKAFELQKTSDAPFDVCCDLEDGSPRGEESKHLELFISLIKEQRAAKQRVGARIHDVQGEFWWTELQRLIGELGSDLAFLAVPKSRSVRDVETVIDAMLTLKTKHKLEKLPPLHILIESIGGLEDARKIAALPGVEALEFGLMDFISDHHGAIPEECLRSPGQWEHQLIIRAKTEMVAAALANGCVPAHNVCLALDNPEQVRAEATAAAKFYGFLRMWSIHPSQIAPINEVFSPDFSQLEKAKRVIAAAKEADWGPIRLDGLLYDRASYRFYWTMLRRAELAKGPRS